MKYACGQQYGEIDCMSYDLKKKTYILNIEIGQARHIIKLEMLVHLS